MSLGNLLQLLVIGTARYSSAPISMGNTFQDLPQLRETMDKHDTRVTYVNTVKFNLNYAQ
jgi:hypothetical protein